MADDQKAIAALLAALAAGSGAPDIAGLINAMAPQAQVQPQAQAKPWPFELPQEKPLPWNEQKPNPVAKPQAPAIGGGFGVPGLVDAVIAAESSGNPDAVSPVGARGLMQIMPATGEEFAKKLGMDWNPESLADPEYNKTLGQGILKDYIGRFGGDVNLGLAAYNAGPSRVRRLLDSVGGNDIGDIWHRLPKETQGYVSKIQSALGGSGSRM